MTTLPRYYYAIVECDTVEAASHIFSELEGTELERSANVFDLSFVPDGMTFDDEPRFASLSLISWSLLTLTYSDEATDDSAVPYKGLDFVTDVRSASRTAVRSLTRHLGLPTLKSQANMGRR